MSRISKRLDKFLTSLQAEIQHCSNIRLRIAMKDESLPTHFQHSVDFYSGLIAGKVGAMESLLMAHNIYRGFNEIDATCPITKGIYTYPHYYRTGQ